VRGTAGIGDFDALSTTVVRIRDSPDVAGLLELPQLPGDMRGFHGQLARQHSGAQRLTLSDAPQDRRGGPVQGHSGRGHEPLVLPGPAGEVRDAAQGLLDLGHLRPDGRCSG
jgi:hypothetical protein